MQYRLVYLIAGERRTAGIEAADAASALAALPERTQARFELLAVLRTDLAACGPLRPAGQDRPKHPRHDRGRA